jgi:hypothetical protein
MAATRPVVAVSPKSRLALGCESGYDPAVTTVRERR